MSQGRFGVVPVFRGYPRAPGEAVRRDVEGPREPGARG